jgi:hypothetical protein
MKTINDLQNELRNNYKRTGSIAEWWDKGTNELKELIGLISIKLELITPNTPWSDTRKYNDMLRTKQRGAIDRCCALLNYDWTVVDAGMIVFK